MGIETVSTDRAPAAIGPYSQAKVVGGGDLVFTSGQLPMDPETGEITGRTIEEQAEQVFDNIKAILVEAGTSLKNVVKVNVYLKDLADFQKMNEIYARYFTEKPARTTLQVAAIPKGALIEVDVIAVK